MYQKDNLTKLMNAVDNNADEAQKNADKQAIREACLNILDCVHASKKASMMAQLDGADAESVATLKKEKSDRFRRAVFNVISLNALADFYGVEKLFGGDVSSTKEIGVFCNEFAVSLYAG